MLILVLVQIFPTIYSGESSLNISAEPSKQFLTTNVFQLQFFQPQKSFSPPTHPNKRRIPSPSHAHRRKTLHALIADVCHCLPPCSTKRKGWRDPTGRKLRACGL